MWLKLGELLNPAGNHNTMTRQEKITKLLEIFHIQDPQVNHIIERVDHNNEQGNQNNIELEDMQVSASTSTSTYCISSIFTTSITSIFITFITTCTFITSIFTTFITTILQVHYIIITCVYNVRK